MDSTTWSVWIAAATLAALVGLAWMRFRQNARARGRTPLVDLVRRRRELTARLNELAGPSATELARLEARRRNASPISIEALEAAVARAERLALKSEPEPER